MSAAARARVLRIFSRVPFPCLLGFRLDSLGPGLCRMSVRMRDDLRQRYGMMHGGVIASLVDTAAAYAVYPLVSAGQEITTVEFKISFLSPVGQGGRAVCQARILRQGRTLAVVACDVRDGRGKPVAAALVTYMVIAAPPGAPARSASTQPR
jgi:uncharacterized protein (TIGR00369 family)